MLIAMIAVSIVILLLVGAGHYFYELAIKPGGLIRLAKKLGRDTDTPADPFYTEASDWWNGKPTEVLRMTSGDGLALQGYYLKNSTPSGRLAFLIHGYSGKAEEMAAYAKIYYDMGFTIFAPDNRGHGQSEGHAVGMGWLDRLDCLRWIASFVEQNSNLEIIIHGHSMGGATACLLAGEILPPNVKGIISDCAYDSITNVFAWQLKNLFKLPAFPLIHITSLICKLRAGYFFGDGNITAAVARSKIPISFIHGDSDRFVPTPMVYNLYNAANPSLRDIWVVKGAKHIESMKTEPEAYADLLRAFVGRVCE